MLEKKQNKQKKKQNPDIFHLTPILNESGLPKY